MPKIRTRSRRQRSRPRWGTFFPTSTLSFICSGLLPTPRQFLTEEKAVEEGAAQLKAAGEEFGISGLVDWAPADLGRDMGLMVELSRASGWDIVACTGIFGAWGYPAYWEAQSTEAIEDFFTREIEEGAVDEGVRCGIIKVGTRLQPHERPIGPNAPLDHLLSERDRRVLESAARVQAKLGTPIGTHTDSSDWPSGNVGLAHIDTLVNAGADPERCIIGHVSQTTNVGQIVEILESAVAS